MIAIGNAIGISFGGSGGVDWASYIPSNLTITIPGATQAELFWDDGSNAGDGLRIYYSTDNINFTELATVNYGEEYYNHIGLTANQIYYYRLVAYKGSGESDPVTANTELWWMADGIAAEDVLAVYFPVGAASKVESLKNIINPGTADMVESGTVSWDKSVGWYGFSDTAYLDGISNKSHTYSIVVLADYFPLTGLRRVVSAEAAGPTGTLLVANYDNNAATAVRYRQGTYAGTAALNKERLLFGASQTKCFINGVDSGAITPSGGEVTCNLRVGNYSTTPTSDGACKGRVLAIAIYDHSLTDAQMISIHNKMKNLGYFRDFSGMTKYVGNPIITKGAEAWRLDGASVPYVQPDNLSNDGYYYAFVPVSAGGWIWKDLALFRSNDLLNWLPYGVNPVLSCIPASWEENFISHPCPIKIGDTYYLYYTSSDALNKSRLGRIYSSDLITWSRDAGNPLYEDPSENCHSAWLIKNGVTYYLYYRKNTDDNSPIYYATSSDAVNFTYQGACFSTISGDIDYDNFALDPFVWKRKDGIYEMLYVGFRGITPYQKIAYAISSDGINFHKKYNWILKPTSNLGDWDYVDIGVPLLFKISNKQTYLYYCGAAVSPPPAYGENSGGVAIIPN